jgi:mxaJ protein
MFSSFLKFIFLKFILILVFATPVAVPAQTVLTVCADPQNPPFSTRAATGFENKIAKLIAAELHEPVRFHWQRMGRGFVREIVNKGLCDAVIAVPMGMRGVRVTSPYYRSTYVFVTPRAAPAISSLDDPRLRQMKIGVQVLDDDYAPPARALARRSLTQNVVGFEMDENAGEIISAVAKKGIDAAIVWGPLAGFYAKRYGSALRISPVTPEIDPPLLPFSYEIGIGVRESDAALFDKLEQAVRRAQPRINRILKAYGVPTLPLRESTGSVERAGQ